MGDSPPQVKGPPSPKSPKSPDPDVTDNVPVPAVEATGLPSTPAVSAPPGDNYILTGAAIPPTFDLALAALRSSGLHGRVDLSADNVTTQIRLDPKKLDRLTMTDGTLIRVLRNPGDYPDDPEVLRRWDNHYAVFEISNPELGYVAYMGIHRLTQIASNVPVLNGQWRATGGTRIRNYAAGPLGALLDALELSQEMSFKAAGAGLKIGGSKCAIHVASINPSPRGPDGEARNRVLASYAQAIEEIGRLIGGGVLTGQDMNISETDAQLLFAHAPTSIVPYVAGALSRTPTPATAVGVWAAMSAAMAWAWPQRTSEVDDGPFFVNPVLDGKVVAVQGVGGIGALILLPLLAANAIVIASDVNPDTIAKLFEDQPALKTYRATGRLHIFAEERLPEGGFSSHIVSPLTAFPALRRQLRINHVDIFMPFAVGGVLNDITIPQLRDAGVKLVVGSANDMSGDKLRHPQMLHDGGILYVPDYIANAGGLLVVDGHLGHEVTDEAISTGMTDRVIDLLTDAAIRKLTPQEIADKAAQRFFERLPAAPLPIRPRLASGDQAVVIGGAVLAGEPVIRDGDGILQPISLEAAVDEAPAATVTDDITPPSPEADPASLMERGLMPPAAMRAPLRGVLKL